MTSRTEAETGNQEQQPRLIDNEMYEVYHSKKEVWERLFKAEEQNKCDTEYIKTVQATIFDLHRKLEETCRKASSYRAAFVAVLAVLLLLSVSTSTAFLYGGLRLYPGDADGNNGVTAFACDGANPPGPVVSNISKVDSNVKHDKDVDRGGREPEPFTVIHDGRVLSRSLSPSSQCRPALVVGGKSAYWACLLRSHYARAISRWVFGNGHDD